MPPTSWLYQWVEEEVPVKAGDSWTPGSGSARPGLSLPIFGIQTPSLSLGLTPQPCPFACPGVALGTQPSQLAHFVSRPILPQPNLITPGLLPFVPDKRFP